jgi:hypothetical protein
MTDASGATVFDLSDRDKSLPQILADFSVDLRLLMETHLRKGLASDYPCEDVGFGITCTDGEWRSWVSNALRLYNGTDRNRSSPYPDNVYAHLIAPTPAFGGNVSYSDPVP